MASSDNKFLYNFVQLEGNATECCSYKAHISVSLFIAIAVQSLAFTFCLSLYIYIHICIFSLLFLSLFSLLPLFINISLPFTSIYRYLSIVSPYILIHLLDYQLIGEPQSVEDIKHCVPITPIDLHCVDDFAEIGYMMIITQM